MKKNRGYEFDRYADAIFKLASKALKTEEFDSPITGMWLYSGQSEYHVTCVLVDSAEGTQEIELDTIDDTLIPSYAGDELEEILETFIEENELDPDEVFWGDYGKLPHSLLCYVLGMASDKVAEAFKKRKDVRFASKFQCGICIDDERMSIKEIRSWASSIKKDLKKLGEKREKFLSLCLSNPRSLDF